MDNKAKQFQLLKAKWYKKLKDSGFEDAEYDDNTLRVWHSYRFIDKHEPLTAETKEEYYRMSGHFLNEYKFQDKTDKFIWSKHSAGVGVREIARLLIRKGYKIKKSSVHLIVSRLEEEMYKKYRPKDDKNE